MKWRSNLLLTSFKFDRFYFLGSLFLVLVLFTTLSSCTVATTRPKMELKLAQVAFAAAQNAGAEELSPEKYRLAEIGLIKAKSAYRRKAFSSARKFCLISIKYSEQAELEAAKAKFIRE
jgi:hypothetical protein